QVDVRTGKTLKEWKTPQAEVVHLALSVDGKRLMTGTGAGGQRAIMLWDPATGKELTPLAKGRKVEATAAAVSPDGSGLATAQTARQVRLWDTATGKELQRLTTGTPDPNALINLAFAPDGKVLAVSVGGSIRLWEAATGKPVAIPGADHPLVSAAALSPDGTT